MGRGIVVVVILAAAGGTLGAPLASDSDQRELTTPNTQLPPTPTRGGSDTKSIQQEDRKVTTTATPTVIYPTHTIDERDRDLPSVNNETYPAHSKLRVSDPNHFLIAQIADVHLTGNDTFDKIYIDLVRNVLDRQGEIELAVLSGDQIIGASIERGHNKVWNNLTSLLTQRGIWHTSLLGNHDGEPFLADDGYVFEVADNATNGRTWEVQTMPGEESRDDLMKSDAATWRSLSQAAPVSLGNASSAFIVDVLPPPGTNDSDRPLFSIFHLDTGDGGMPIGIGELQKRWFLAELQAHHDLYAPEVPPVLVFAHFPMKTFLSAWHDGQEAGVCTGQKVRA